jgi:bud site selection protein 31
MSKWSRAKKAPAGYEDIEPIITALEHELRDQVNAGHEGLRKGESIWPVHQLNNQKSRYVYDLYYVHNRISKAVYDFCVQSKIVDAALIAKWKKPGYERLCSTFVINAKNYKFGTVSICRVPISERRNAEHVQDPNTGCLGCASGKGGNKNVFGNKYGQNLAAIQIAREMRAAEQKERLDAGRKEREEYAAAAAASAASKKKENDGDDETDEEDSDDEDDYGPAMPTPAAAAPATGAWAQDEEEAKLGNEEEEGESSDKAAGGQKNGRGGGENEDRPGKKSRN